ncbi:MAG: DHH family phosphoesterase [Polyangiaceae bacterium]|nr:DHH family phosphoesterase [Polyangiaceae bacterium]
MTHYYAFNGDADGLCALQQLWRSGAPGGVLVTGVKRDIALLERVDAVAGDQCTVLDVSLDVNRAGLLSLLAAGVLVRYFDHHFAGEVPAHPGLEAHLDPSAEVCTSILVDRWLGGSFRRWAVVGAFGDGLTSEGHALARAAALPPSSVERLRELGVAINYNAYGETIADLHVAPAVLAEEMAGYADPLDFAEQSMTYRLLAQGYASDMERARALAPERAESGSVLFVLPDAPWARRASGTLANDLAKTFADRAVAIVSPKSDGGYLVSLRVPKGAAVGADEFCRRFPSGGGRKAAAGINHLPAAELGPFADAFAEQFARGA